MPCYQLDERLWFPPVSAAEEYGLLAVGGDLSVERLLLAYRLGIFPWYSEGEPILWWSPDPRCILLPSQIHLSRSLRKTVRRNVFTVSFNRNFEQVIRSCRESRIGAQREGTWILPDMEAAYIRLHRRGYAHSVECWQGDELAGGLYGVCMGRCFFGESMFSRRTDASKVALAWLARSLEDAGFALIDCQQTTEHLLSLGAQNVSRQRFLSLLDSGEVGSEHPLVSRFPLSPVVPV